MGKSKLFRFAENERYVHVIQPSHDELVKGLFPLKGHWNERYFERQGPLILELGCGKGEYTTGLARLHPGNNYIGVDIKGARIWRGAKTAADEQLRNVGFLRSHADRLTDAFGEQEVDEIWLTFSDPQRKKSKARKRLTSPLFMARYREVLKPGGVVHLKTDSSLLYEYTMQVIEQERLCMEESSTDVHGELVDRVPDDLRNALQIRTYYESKWLAEGLTINYLRFNLGND